VTGPNFIYEYTTESSGVSGQLYVTPAGEELPAYFSSAPRPARHRILNKVSRRTGGSPVMPAR
jgi:hypothetical protein